ncbi:MAG: hypothetical protein U1E65_32755 [Myxococcota bacterium]
MTDKPRATPRVREHVDRLREAGFDTAKFFDALVALRDDVALPRAHRESIYKLLAMESFVWYLEAIRNEPLDREKLLVEARKIQEELSAAIAKPEGPGGVAEKLAAANVGKAPAKAAEPPIPAPKAKPGAAPLPPPKKKP